MKLIVWQERRKKKPGIRHNNPVPITQIITPRNGEKSSSKHETFFSTLSI
jgi:hypothetical protein